MSSSVEYDDEKINQHHGIQDTQQITHSDVTSKCLKKNKVKNEMIFGTNGQQFV